MLVDVLRLIVKDFLFRHILIFFFFNSYNNHKIINRCEEFNGEAIKSLPIDGKNITEFKRYNQCLMKPFFTFYNIESELIEITEENKLNHY